MMDLEKGEMEFGHDGVSYRVLCSRDRTFRCLFVRLMAPDDLIDLHEALIALKRQSVLAYFKVARDCVEWYGVSGESYINVAEEVTRAIHETSRKKRQS